MTNGGAISLNTYLFMMEFIFIVFNRRSQVQGTRGSEVQRFRVAFLLLTFTTDLVKSSSS